MPTHPTAPPRDDAGDLISRHRARPLLRRMYTGMAAAGLLGAIAGWAWGLARGYFAIANYGPAVMWRFSAPFLIAGSVLGLIAVLGGAGLWRIGRLEVSAHRKALIVQRGRRRRAIPWEQVDSVRTTAVRYRLPGLGGRSRLELVLGLGHAGADGRGARPATLRFTQSLEDLDRLATSVKQQVYPRLLEQSARAFNQGNALSFGPMQMTADGVRAGRRLIRWHDLRGAALDQGELVLLPAAGRGDSPVRIAARRIPNVEVCVQLIQVLSRRP